MREWRIRDWEKEKKNKVYKLERARVEFCSFSEEGEL